MVFHHTNWSTDLQHVTNIDVVLKCLRKNTSIWELLTASVNFQCENSRTLLVDWADWSILSLDLLAIYLQVEDEMTRGPKTSSPGWIWELKLNNVSIMSQYLFLDHFQFEYAILVF